MAFEEPYCTPEERAHDPREHQEWFLRLPEHFKEELRRLWRGSEDATAQHRERRTRTTNRYLIEGVAFFVIVYWVFYPFGAYGLLLTAVTGLVVGCANAYLRAGAYQYGWVCAIGYAVFGLMFLGWLSIFPFLFSTCGGTVLGVGHTLNRQDFTET